MKTTSILCATIFGAAMWVGEAQAKSEASRSADDEIQLLDALKRGYVDVTVAAARGAVTLKILREQDAPKNAMVLVVPRGAMRFGFIENRTISTGSGYRRKDNAGQSVLTLLYTVRTNDLDRRGFRLDVKRGTRVLLAANEKEAAAEIDGQFSLEVPSGYSGFPLAGLSGAVTTGEMSVERLGEKSNKRYRIRFGAMEVRRDD